MFTTLVMANTVEEGIPYCIFISSLIPPRLPHLKHQEHRKESGYLGTVPSGARVSEQGFPPSSSGSSFCTESPGSNRNMLRSRCHGGQEAACQPWGSVECLCKLRESWIHVLSVGPCCAIPRTTVFSFTQLLVSGKDSLRSPMTLDSNPSTGQVTVSTRK